MTTETPAAELLSDLVFRTGHLSVRDGRAWALATPLPMPTEAEVVERRQDAESRD